jgi:sulfur-oxidizing protein SoxX
VLLAGCATRAQPAELDAQAHGRHPGVAFATRALPRSIACRQDLGQAACSSDKLPADEVADLVKAEALASIKWPAGGQFLGDWNEGETLAQSGRGMTWTDPPADPKANGGNCYNCHQIDQQGALLRHDRALACGTTARTRGITDVTADTAAPIVHYTWAKLWNSKAYAACSNMPRFGHMELLDEEQMRHIMALLLDPRSPVNQ